ncbi:MAG: SHOCT domain-containing protein [Nitrosarchaeum sp.]|nr:SHOCT domain-containing protein [Nitrosarchaeum sp.]
MFVVGIGSIMRGALMKSEFRFSKIILGTTLSVLIYLGADMFFHYPYRTIIQVSSILIIVWILRKNKKAKEPDYLVILKQRYAKGEITKDEFDRVKEELKD